LEFKGEGGKTDLCDLVELNEKTHSLPEEDHPAGISVVVCISQVQYRLKVSQTMKTPRN
jgi:hypothetical protein